MTTWDQHRKEIEVLSRALGIEKTDHAACSRLEKFWRERCEALEAALREIATQCEHMAAAEVFDPDWVIDIARKALGEGKP